MYGGLVTPGEYFLYYLFGVVVLVIVAVTFVIALIKNIFKK